MSEKIKYWWSGDRKWFCLLVNDGTNQVTVSLSVEETESLLDEVIRTPGFLAFQKECADRAVEMAQAAASNRMGDSVEGDLTGET